MTSYPITTLPLQLGIAKSKITMDSAVSVSESAFTFEQQVYVHAGQRWKIMVTLPPMKRANAEQWITALASLNGRQGTFLMGDSDGAKPRGQGTGVPFVSTADQTGNSVSTYGWTPGVTGILKAGDYFQLNVDGGAARLYKALADVNSDGGGNANIPIWPNLRVPTAGNDPIFVLNAATQFRLDAPFAWDADQVSTYGAQFSATEAL